jgi:hypothetical protein
LYDERHPLDDVWVHFSMVYKSRGAVGVSS